MACTAVGFAVTPTGVVADGFTMILFRVTHCWNVPGRMLFTVKPGRMAATVGCGLESVRFCEPVIVMSMKIWVGSPKLDATPSWQALARTLVIRMMRVELPGASIGTPVQVMACGRAGFQ